MPFTKNSEDRETQPIKQDGHPDDIQELYQVTLSTLYIILGTTKP